MTTEGRQVAVTQADEKLARLCIPAAMIFAETEEHIAHARALAAQHIARRAEQARIEALEQAATAVEAHCLKIGGIWDRDEIAAEFPALIRNLKGSPHV